MTVLWPDWHRSASCLGEDEVLFFGSSSPSERPAYTLSSIEKAKRKCSGCPVFENCLRQSIVNREAYGVWAGTTMKERGRIFARISSRETTEEQEIQRLLERRAECQR